MSFSCGCDDSDWGIVDEYEEIWTGHKTIRCKECGCELAPGHVVHTTIMAVFGEDPFEDMDEETLDLVLASDETIYTHTCERCADLESDIMDLGMCWYGGEMWGSYREWLDARGLPYRTDPGRHDARIHPIRRTR